MMQTTKKTNKTQKTGTILPATNPGTSSYTNEPVIKEWQYTPDEEKSYNQDTIFLNNEDSSIASDHNNSYTYTNNSKVECNLLKICLKWVHHIMHIKKL